MLVMTGYVNLKLGLIDRSPLPVQPMSSSVDDSKEVG